MRRDIHETSIVRGTKRPVGARSGERFTASIAVLDPTVVDAVFADETGAIEIPCSDRREMAPAGQGEQHRKIDAAHAAAQGEGESDSFDGDLLRSLSEQLFALERQQAQIRNLLSRVNRN